MKRLFPFLILGVALAGCGSGDTAADPNAAKAGDSAPAQAQAQQGTQTSPDEANQRAAAAAKGNG